MLYCNNLPFKFTTYENSQQIADPLKLGTVDFRRMTLKLWRFPLMPLRSAGRPGLDLPGAQAHGEICYEDLDRSSHGG